jgi:hypothetical protein
MAVVVVVVLVVVVVVVVVVVDLTMSFFAAGFTLAGSSIDMLLKLCTDAVTSLYTLPHHES